MTLVFDFIRPPPDVSARLADPTPLLRHLTGEAASMVARLWPAPHLVFLAMPAGRRHLVCFLLLSLETQEPTGLPDWALADMMETARARDLLTWFTPEAPEGLARAFDRMGEIGWPAADYHRLLTILAAPNGAKLVQHAQVLTPELFASIAALPEALRLARLLAWLGAPGDAALIEEAYGVIAARGDKAAANAAARWARAKSPAQLFEWAGEDVAGDILAPDPPSAEDGFVKIGTRRDLAGAGARFRNCLASYSYRVASGEAAVYLWAGPPPLAIALVRDPVYGWILEQARGHANAAVDAQTRARVTGFLTARGVHVGPSGHVLASKLSSRAYGLREGVDAPLDPFG